MPHHFKCVPSSLLVLFCDEEDLLLGATPDQPHKGLVYCDRNVGGGGGEGEPEDHLLVVVSCEAVLGGGGVAQSGETEWGRGCGCKSDGEERKEKGRKTHKHAHRNAWLVYPHTLHVESISENSSCVSSETGHTTHV